LTTRKQQTDVQMRWGDEDNGEGKVKEKGEAERKDEGGNSRWCETEFPNIQSHIPNPWC
jgi:hypothetical protein